MPIALSVKGRQYAHELWHYKDSPSPQTRRSLQARLTAVLSRFLEAHEGCITAAMRTEFAMVTTVPSLRGRDGTHPLQRIVASGIRSTAIRHRQLLVPGARDGGGRTFDAQRFQVVGPVPESILLIDDTWTTGSRVQSAAAALKSAGARRTAAVILGRHFDPAFGQNQAFLNVLGRTQRFDWGQCCLQYRNE